MAEKKHIDRLFQERFKDFEATPSEAVWENIAAKLNTEEEKRRIIPIWWRYAGVAALLLLFIGIGNFLISDNNSSTIQVVDTNDDMIENASEVLKNTINNTIEQAPSVVNSNAENDSTGTTEQTSNTNNNTSAAVASSKSEKQNHTPKKTATNFAVSKSHNTKSSEEQHFEKTTSDNTTTNSAIAASVKKENNGPVLIDKEAAKTHISNVSKNNSTIAEVNKPSKQNELTIEEAMAESKGKVAHAKPESKWSVTPNVAPVYFNSLGEGSSIDQQFNNNQKTGDVNMSYGISTSYAVNNRIKIRSGINKVNLGYNTNNVVVYESRGSGVSALQNVKSSSSNLSVASAENTQGFPQSISSSNVSIHQTFDYIEIPLEIQYAISQKRFGVNVIGGFSSFFLSDNGIYSEGEDGSNTYLGEANNINNTSYSANVGLGLNYKFSKKFDLNLEPMFKYQFNTFDNTSGNFTPFFIGVYTGFSFKF
ncbi:outer membrane beta-barrel protein [Pseudotamlana agarivorans]|uniref:outer membrane beta-barrel protein n=1 Tax=Pseudotamlana agarivorans TaxID=481183 RepID=UPI0008312FA2|nr:PorT family protein [Tamlana agarivorans]